MKRRAFLQTTAASGLLSSGVSVPGQSRAAQSSPKGSRTQKLFDTSVIGGRWSQFAAAEFSKPVCGVVYRRAHSVLHGMPLGGVSTGFMDLETNGTFGFSTIFNSGVPARGPLGEPFLGLRLENKTWVMTLQDTLGTGNARDVHYWGHYPVADMEFETTAPVTTGVRAWTPFIP